MRTFYLLLAFGLMCLLSAAETTAQEKEKEKRKPLAELEKILVLGEAELAKQDKVIKQKEFMEKIVKSIEKADSIDLYRLNPKKLAKPKEGVKTFHDYEITGEAKVQTDKQKDVADFLTKTLHWNEQRKKLCFDPRHGLRAYSGKKTLDLVICLSCNRVQLYDGEKFLGEWATVNSDAKNNLLEQTLSETDKKTPEKKTAEKTPEPKTPAKK